MPIIFGIKRKAYRLATVFAMCGICQTPAAQVVSRVRTFFSLFFIPIVPVSSSYRSTCTMCGGSVKITKEAAQHTVAGAERASAEQNNVATNPAPLPGSPPPAVPGSPIVGTPYPDAQP
jgi:hypothetical protein